MDQCSADPFTQAAIAWENPPAQSAYTLASLITHMSIDAPTRDRHSSDAIERDFILNLKTVTKTYPPEQTALHNIDLQVQAGEFVFLAGASGAGKSTLLKLLFGAEVASRGQVIVAGRNVSALSRDHIALLSRQIGVVFQDYKLLPRRTVLAHIAFTLEVQGVEQRARRRRAFMLLCAMGLKDKANAMPLTLSGGEQQRVALARALINKPRILLADEPTGNLDPRMTRTVFDIVLDANAHGMTVVVATHNLTLVEELNRRTVVLDNGKLLGDFQSPLD